PPPVPMLPFDVDPPPDPVLAPVELPPLELDPLVCDPAVSACVGGAGASFPQSTVARPDRTQTAVRAQNRRFIEDTPFPVRRERSARVPSFASVTSCPSIVEGSVYHELEIVLRSPSEEKFGLGIVEPG